jgi:hemerythrin-like domain-containing protein
MSALIKEFKSEHSKIIKVLSDVEEFGILTKEGQTKLMSLKPSLIEHLSKEDGKLYPVLWQKAEQNKMLQEKLAIYAEDLENVSRVVFEFFDKCDKGVLGEKSVEEFGYLFKVLRYRMGKEESFLYGEYEELNKL